MAQVKSNRAFLILFVIVMFACTSTFFLCVRAIDNNNKAFCLALQNRTEYPVKRPLNPALHRAQEIDWERYVRATKASKELGCKS
jgi:hypothetical protein